MDTAKGIAPEAVRAPPDLLDLDGIVVSYARREALRVERVRLAPGAVGLLGPNGAGKSTLLKVLLGLLPIDHGRGTVLGLEIGREAVSIRERVGYMSEDDCFVPGFTAVEIVTLAGELAGMPRRDALGRAHEVLSYLGLDEARYRRVEEYSSGMLQRLKLAQALVHDPPLLILDEPTNGLDPSGRRQILDLIGILNHEHGKSVLLSTHLLEDVERVCDSTLILDHGRVIASGPLDTLLSQRPGRYRLELQGDGSAYLERLETEGVRVLSAANGPSAAGGHNFRIVTAETPADFAARRFFEILANMDPARTPVLRSLRPDPERLEDLFSRLLQGGEAIGPTEEGPTGGDAHER